MGTNDPHELTDEAKAEIQAAIAIVREDRFEKFLRGRLAGPSTDTAPGAGDPPPPKPGDPVTGNGDNGNPNGGTKKRGLYWGDSE